MKMVQTYDSESKTTHYGKFKLKLFCHISKFSCKKDTQVAMTSSNYHQLSQEVNRQKCDTLCLVYKTKFAKSNHTVYMVYSKWLLSFNKNGIIPTT